MRFNRLNSMLRKLYKFFIAPKQWRLPKKSEILIYDACEAEVFAPYLTGYSVEIIPVRGESINIPCLLRAILKLGFWRGKPIQFYVDAFIQAVSPQVVVTFVDNNSDFYTISSRFSGVKTIMLQDGIRGNFLDGFANSDTFCVDYMLKFNAAIGEYYRKFISGEIIVIGSLKNNGIRQSTDNNVLNGSVLFISQYIAVKPNDNRPLLFADHGTPVYFDQFFAAEVKTLNFLNRWCRENNKFLRICGLSFDKEGAERDFYTANLNECMWEYIPRSNTYSSYKLVEAAEIVVFVDSALGYEAIGRGKKSAALTCRDNFIGTCTRKFGWPASLPGNGPFWTNDADEKQFQRVMDYLNTVSGEEWEQTLRLYARKVMEFDAGNTRFKALLDKLLPKSKDHVSDRSPASPFCADS